MKGNKRALREKYTLSFVNFNIGGLISILWWSNSERSVWLRSQIELSRSIPDSRNLCSVFGNLERNDSVFCLVAEWTERDCASGMGTERFRPVDFLERNGFGSEENIS
jgi:hypothetical protein